MEEVVRDERASLLPHGLCTACPVLQGECPTCGTFWIVMPGGKRHGLTPTQRQMYDGPTNHLFTRNQLDNFVEQPVTDEMIESAKQRLADEMARRYRDGEPWQRNWPYV